MPEKFYEGKETMCDCGHIAVATKITTGYGTDPATGKTHCYDCCALADAKGLRETGKLVGYLCYDSDPHSYRKTGIMNYNNARFTNWPGSFSVTVYHVKKSFNNFGAVRLDFWFTWEGNRYWGVNVGDSQIARVRKIKG